MARTILKTLVGSRAHGLADADSDYDYRGVFVEPTEELLKLGGSTRRTSWIERDDAGQAVADDTAWEVGHFLGLAAKCNPTMLEVLVAPVIECDAWGAELRTLLPFLWEPHAARNAFIGYGLNQQKKLLTDKDGRPAKYACAYLRVLASAVALFETGVPLMDMSGHELFATLRRFRAWEGVTKGEVIDLCTVWQARVESAAAACSHKPDMDRVNDYLLRLRRAEWTTEEPARG